MKNLTTLLSSYILIINFFIIVLTPSKVKAQSLPQIGAQVWLESWHTAEHTDKWFKMLADHHMPVARIFIGQGDPAIYDNAFQSAQKYGVKIQATLTVPEHPNSEEDLKRYSEYVKRTVNRYKDHPALETWWLINEPGQGPSSSPLAIARFKAWLEKRYISIQALNSSWRKNFSSFNDVHYNENWVKTANFSNTADYFDWFLFSRDYLTWIQQWIADEVRHEDTAHPFHVNPHGIFNNLIQYDFPSWRQFLSSLGASIHPSWHFGFLNRNQYAMGIAATCEIIKGGSEPNPFWVSELQAGNNIWSGSQPLGPEAEDIAQWTWTSIGCGAEKVIYWLLNNRSRGGESGEWSMLDFQGNPGDRLMMASRIAQTIGKEKAFFDGAKPLERKVVILLSPESMLVLARKAGKDGLAGRSANAHIISALAYYEALSDLGIPAVFKYTNDFDWENKSGCLAIFPDAVAVPSAIVKRAEVFVANGNKLIIDGLTGFFDENEVNVLQSGFFFEKLCGATVREIRTKSNLFFMNIDKLNLPVPAHLWQTEILNKGAQPIAHEGDRITGVRHVFGKGEVIWIPSALGLGAWHNDNRALASLLRAETGAIQKQLPFHFAEKYDHVVLSILKNNDAYVSVITNGADRQQKISLRMNMNLKPVVVFNSANESFKLTTRTFSLAPRQTLVIMWKP